MYEKRRYRARLMHIFVNSLKLVTWYLDQVVILVCISLSFIKVNYIILHKMSLLAAGKDLQYNLAASWRVEVGGWRLVQKSRLIVIFTQAPFLNFKYKFKGCFGELSVNFSFLSHKLQILNKNPLINSFTVFGRPILNILAGSKIQN